LRVFWLIPPSKTILFFVIFFNKFVFITSRNFLFLLFLKIGLKKIYPENEVLINRFLEILESENLDFTNSFRGLIKEVESSNQLISKTDTFKSWKMIGKSLLKIKVTKKKFVKLLPQITQLL